MRKISTKNDVEKLNGVPPPVLDEIKKYVALLNLHYGENRNVNTDLGGYVLLVEQQNKLKDLKKFFHQDICEIYPESVVEILDFTISHILLSCDFSIILVMKKSITPASFLASLSPECD